MSKFIGICTWTVLLGGLMGGCVNAEPVLDTQAAEVTRRCLGAFEAPEQSAVKAELTAMLGERRLEAAECREHGDYLESIRAIEEMIDGSVQADTHGLERFEEERE